MGNPWKEPGLFNNYTDADLKDDCAKVCLQDDGSVEFTFAGSYYGDDVSRDISLENLELLVRAARALKEYTEAEQARVRALQEAG